MKTRIQQWIVGVAVAVVLIAAGPAGAAFNTWTGGGNWDETNGWSLAAVPGPGDDVVISSGTVTSRTSTAALNSYLIRSGATHVFTNWDTLLTAGSVVISGTVTHVVNSDTNGVPGVFSDWTPDARVNIECTSLLVASGGSINADGKGYWGGNAVAFPFKTPGCGPGGGIVFVAAGYGSGSGAGHGGAGGSSGTVGGTNYGFTYDNYLTPTNPGSGGGGRTSYDRQGGAGGGAVRINVNGHARIDGTISAKGANASEWTCGDGAGGSIYLTCQSVAGNGKVLADGGSNDDAGNGSGGGGGRVALVYDTGIQALTNALALPALVLSAGGGVSGAGGDPAKSGGPGTVYCADASFYPSPASVIGGGTPTGMGLSGAVLAFNNLTITNAVFVPPAGMGMLVSNNLSLLGKRAGLDLNGVGLQVNGSLVLNAASYPGPLLLRRPPANGFIIGSNLTVAGQSVVYYTASNHIYSSLAVGQDMVVTNGGRVYLYASPTNASSPGYTVLADIKGGLTVAGGSWIYPAADPTNGGVVKFKVNDLVLLATNGGFNADTYGFSGGILGQIVGWGPGGGRFKTGGTGGTNGCGGGYGGYGANYNTYLGTNYGYPYGAADEKPLRPGSGGGARDDGSREGGYGGGLIWIEASGNATLNGTLSAVGGRGSSDPYNVGAGSGGGIYLQCKRLQGTNAVLNANGGNAYISPYSPYGGAGGGGGRIGIWRIRDASNTNTWTITVNGGTGWTNQTGTAGTVYFGQIPEPGMVLIIE